MKRVNPVTAVVITVVALAALVFSLYRFSGSANANDTVGLTPQPRAGSPTFAPGQGEHVLGRGAAKP